MAKITTLPLELRISILENISDIADLSAAISSHPLLAEALRASSTIVAHVLANEIDSRLWPIAVTIWQIRTKRKVILVYDQHDAMSVLEECQYFNPQDAWECLTAVDLNEAYRYFHQLQRAIDKFTTNYLSIALDFLAVEGRLEHSPPLPSPTEIYRVQRTFYFFEFFCCLWDGGAYVVPWDRTWSLPLDAGFAPWVNEQLASIYEYLLRHISIAFDDEYNIKTVNPEAPDRDNHERKYLVSRGIVYVNKLVEAPTREVRHRLLDAERKQGKCFILDTAIEDLNNSYYHERHYQDLRFGADYMRALQGDWQDPDPSMSGLFLPDLGNSGPAQIWCQSHVSDDHATWGLDFVLSKNFADERRAGYVMWDKWRTLDFEKFQRKQSVFSRFLH